MPDAPAKRRRRWPWIVAGVVLLVFLLRGPLFAPFVAHLVAQQVADAIDGEATVAGAGGGWFTDLRLNGVSAEAPLGTVRRLHIGSLRATYGLGLLAGDPAALRSLDLSGVEATLDLRGGGSAGGAIPPLLDLIPAPLPAASLTGEVVLLTDEREVRLSRLALRTNGGSVTLDVQVQVAESEPLHIVAAFTRPSADTLRLDQAVVLGDVSLDALELVLGHARRQLTATVHMSDGRCAVYADPTTVRATVAGFDLARVPPALVALLPDNLGALAGTLAGEATAVRVDERWNVAGTLGLRDLVVAGLGPFALDSQWRLGDEVVHLPSVRISGPADGTVQIDGLAVALAGRRPHAGTIRAEIPDLRRWLPTNLALPPTAVALSSQLQVEGDTFAITRATLTGGGVALALQGNLVAAPWRIEAADLTARADLATIAGFVPAAPNLAGEVIARVTGTLPLAADPVRLLAVANDIQVRAPALTVGSVALERLRLQLRSGDGALRLTQGEGAIAGIPLAVTGDARWQGGGWIGALSTLSIALPGVQVTAGEACPFLIADGGWSVGPLRLGSEAGKLAFEARQRDGDGLLRVDAPQVDLARLGFPDLAGTASVVIDLAGRWSAPQVDLRLGCPDLRIAGRTAHVDVQVKQDQHGITAQQGRINAGQLGTLLIDGTLPFVLGVGGITAVPDDGKPATLTIDVPELERWLPGRVDAGRIALSLVVGTADDPTALAATLRYADVRPVRATRPTLRPGIPPAHLDGEVVLRADPAGLRLTLAGSADGRAVLTGDLRSDGAWDPVALWQGAGGRPLIGRLRLDGTDIGRFASAIPGVLHLRGRAEGDLAVAGTIAAPLLSGDLALSEVEAKFTELVPTLSDGRARLELRDGRVRLHEAVADLGGEPLRLAGEVVLADEPQLAVTLTGNNVLLVQRHDVRVRADLDLTLAGPPSALVLSGRTMVTNALFSPDLGLFSGGGGTRGDGRVVPFEFQDPPLSTLRFDVAVSSAYGGGRDGVRLVTDLVRADCDFDLHLRGTGAAPELAGRVTVRTGRVFLPFSTLRLSTGELLFPDGDPFHPRINAVATAHVRRWTIALQVDGPLSDPQVRAGGDGLDERDALLLLTTGSTSAELSGEEGQRSALGRLGTWLGVEAWDLIDGEGDPDAGPGLMDRVTLEFGREVSDSGNDTIEAEVELTDPDLVPGVLIYGERDRWDDYNAGLILRFKWGGER